jgi:long-chain fatty acid transport protein
MSARNPKHPGRLLACAGLILILSWPALAVTDEEIFRDFRFDFFDPGGRSLGMGGAFISLADDATAARANPGGLTDLGGSQFFFNLRYASPSDTTTGVRSRAPDASSDGYDLHAATWPDNALSPSFVSFLYPFKGAPLCLGFSREEVLSVHNRVRTSYDVLEGDASDHRVSEGGIDLSLVNWNVSLGWRIAEYFRIGATVSWATMKVSSTVVNTYVDPTGGLIGDPLYSAVPFEMYRTVTDESESAITGTVGVLWKLRHEVTLGATYRRGRTYQLTESLEARYIDTALVPGQISSRVFFDQTGTPLTEDNHSARLPMTIRVPDEYGIGVSWRPTEKWTVAADIDLIRYSGLLEGFNTRLNLLTIYRETKDDDAFTVDDATNVHLGIEYRFSKRLLHGRQLSVRAGWHQDEDHRIRSNFAPGGTNVASNDSFPRGTSESHVSAGAGLAIKNRLRLDLGGDFSGAGRVVVTSMTREF